MSMSVFSSMRWHQREGNLNIAVQLNLSLIKSIDLMKSINERFHE